MSHTSITRLPYHASRKTCVPLGLIKYNRSSEIGFRNWIPAPRWREKEVQGKWKNLKDRFLKSVKEGGTGSDGRRTKRPYIYHKQMQFLLTVYGRRENSEDMNEDKSMDVNDASEAPTLNADEPAIVAGPFLRKLLNRKSNPSERDDLKIASEAPIARVNEPAIVAGPSSRNLKRRKPDPFERDDLKIHQTNERQDADEMFLLSQLPHIKKMKTNNKLEFQVKFLQLIQQYSNECESAYVPTPSFKNSVWSSSSNASATPPHKEFEKDNDSVLSF
ncbi:unnamed protein product [Larinioides sclopetarius]|uniref:BESS domain-containing protein n=1 Tax=Larinioides sclopetarius TaxID=280406 RepID=A0AAV2B7Z2_9ARAC